eukprot:1160570-Pelagomonas_calceolata.AAC.4
MPTKEGSSHCSVVQALVLAGARENVQAAPEAKGVGKLPNNLLKSCFLTTSGGGCLWTAKSTEVWVKLVLKTDETVPTTESAGHTYVRTLDKKKERKTPKSWHGSGGGTTRQVSTAVNGKAMQRVCKSEV